MVFKSASEVTPISTQRLRGGIWPTTDQKLLLQAIFFEGDRGLESWHHWKAQNHLQNLDRGSYRLLPLLYKKLHSANIETQLLPPLKKVYIETFYKNNLLFSRGMEFLKLLQNAGIKTMLLKGAALTEFYYRDIGLRPMDDIDVLIRSVDIERALNLLDGCPNWRLKIPHSDRTSLIRLRHAFEFQDKDGREIDLHQRLVFRLSPTGMDRFWDNSRPVKYRELDTQILSPTDQLFHDLVHGLRWNVIPPIRWVADALVVLRECEKEIDWAHLSRAAVEESYSVKLIYAFDYLASEFSANIPRAFRLELQRAGAGRWLEEVEHWTDSRRVMPFSYTPSFWLRYRLAKKAGAAQTGPLGFLRYLRHLWGAVSWLAFLRVCFRKSVNQMRFLPKP